MQQSYVVIDCRAHLIEIPLPTDEVLPGVKWGSVEAISSPAQWFYLVHARRLQGGLIRSRLGASLREEVAACLLGGHGIPAAVGIAAFHSLKSKGAFEIDKINQTILYEWLSQPLLVNTRPVRYRFANQKSHYLAKALNFIQANQPPMHTGKALRNWLLQIPGIGLKTASWIARNWLEANDVAILDIHILRAGIIGGFFPTNLKVERDYLDLERRFLEFSNAIGIPASELDAEIWYQCNKAPSVIHELFDSEMQMPGRKKTHSVPSSRTNYSQPNTLQQALI